MVISPAPRTSRLEAVGLVLLAGVFCWLNLQPTSSLDRMPHALPPDDLDPLTRSLFYRGWPVSPSLICPFHGMRWHPEEGSCQLALLLDALAALVALAAWVYACRWWRKLPRANATADRHRVAP